MMSAYYNEFDPGAAAWLGELIKGGLIPPGDVDQRSIEYVSADDLEPYRQCHFFAGIGGWPHALKLAGWPDDKPVWTGSCPCPPFSSAGKGQMCPGCGGKHCLSHPLVTAGWICLDCGDQWRGDDRHLLPEFQRLIGQCGPSVVFGEQVASADGRHWLYSLRATLEKMGYAVGAADLCAAGVGAPHIRQRLYWCAHHLRSSPVGLDNAIEQGLEGFGGHGDGSHQPGREQADPARSVAQTGATGGMADTALDGRQMREALHSGVQRQGFVERHHADSLRPTCPTDGFWRNVDWLLCRDARWRAVEPGSFPLAHGLSARVGRLRGYGNAIVPQVASAFIQAYGEALKSLDGF
jgi:DNA (cytosine-5)-methyltransferase 1